MPALAMKTAAISAIASLTFGMLLLAKPACALTYEYTATITNSVNFPGVSIGDQVTGTFEYDPANNLSSSRLFSASVGSFNLTENFNFSVLNNTPPTADETFIEGTGSTQFGVFMSDVLSAAPGTALTGSTMFDLNWDLSDWYYEKVRYNYFSSPTTLVQGWTADITSITPEPLTVPEPASIALLGAGLLGFGWARRRRATS